MDVGGHDAAQQPQLGCYLINVVNRKAFHGIPIGLRSKEHFGFPGRGVLRWLRPFRISHGVWKSPNSSTWFWGGSCAAAPSSFRIGCASWPLCPLPNQHWIKNKKNIFLILSIWSCFLWHFSSQCTCKGEHVTVSNILHCLYNHLYN